MSRKNVLIVGGGVIGLSVTWELNRRGFQTTIVDRHSFGTKASWAGAGILSPANFQTMTQPLDRLKAYGSELHKNWSTRLQESTGIDNGYRECGGLYVARTAGEQATLMGQLYEWNQYQIGYEVLDRQALVDPLSQSPRMAVAVSGESQIDNRSHLDALAQACRGSGSTMIPHCGQLQFKFDEDHCEAAFSGQLNLDFDFDHLCIAAGAWTSALVEQFNVCLPVIPVRGQMVLYKLKQKIFEAILNEGSRYIVPRDDGHVLVGSTTEEVGFDESTTEIALAELQQFACDWLPQLNLKSQIASWAGLRPASHDGFPFMGRLAEYGNVWVATGHFKSGLQMSPAVGEIMADLIEGKSTRMETESFDPSRLNIQAT